MSLAERDIITTEVRTIMSLKHKNIIKIKEYIEESSVVKRSGEIYLVQCVLVEELASGGELFYYVLNSGFFEEKITRYYARQLL